jgi:hypothetical protein
VLHAIGEHLSFVAEILIELGEERTFPIAAHQQVECRGRNPDYDQQQDQKF